jgi:hypothetical protein
MNKETLEEAANRILSKEGVKLHPSGLETYLKGNVINAMVEMAKWQKQQDEAIYKELLDSHKELLELIKSDSVYALLRQGVKRPSSTGMDDCDENDYFELYNISTKLRNKQS